MSPKRKELNLELREKRRLQILDAALTVYIQHGYNGTDMDQVAAQAGLAKGLVYYYFKNKRELFRATFDWAFGSLMEVNQALAASPTGIDPVERLVRYVWRVFGLAEKDSRVLRFAMRLPFDAYTVFGPQEWREGLKRSNLHQDTLAAMIRDISAGGVIPPVNAVIAANNFWAVFIANCFSFQLMIGGTREQKPAPTMEERIGEVREIVTFCFQGLGLPYDVWGKYLERMEKDT